MPQDASEQSHWHEPSGGKKAGYGRFARPKSPCDLFMDSEGIPIFRDIGVSKVRDLPRSNWQRRGGTPLPYRMKDPYVRKEYKETLIKEGVENRMQDSFLELGAKVADIGP